MKNNFYKVLQLICKPLRIKELVTISYCYRVVAIITNTSELL